MSARTKIIVIEQEALEPWKGQVDLADAALLNHVVVRLTRRMHQKVVLHEGEPCVWVHYPTVRAENWLIDFTDRGLQARFAKLVRLGLLIRTQLSVSNNGTCRGSRAYYGIGPALKARLEAVDSTDTPAKSVDNSKTDPHGDVAHYDPHGDVAQSLGESLSRRVSAGAGLRSVRPRRPPSALPPKEKPGGKEEGEEEARAKLLDWRREQLRQRIAGIPDQLERCRVKAHYRELGYGV